MIKSLIAIPILCMVWLLSACDKEYTCEIGPKSNELIVAEHSIEDVDDIIVDVTELTDRSYIFGGYHVSGELLTPWIRILDTDGRFTDYRPKDVNGYKSVHGIESGNMLAVSAHYLQELDGNLDVIWSTLLDDYVYYAMIGDTGFALIQQDIDRELFLSRFNSSGNFMWENHNIRQFGSAFDYPVILQDGSIVILDNTSFESRQHVYALDLAGNAIWSNSFEINNCRNCYVNTSAPLKNNEFAVAWIDAYEGTNTEFVGKVDGQGDIQWTRKVPCRRQVRKVAGLQDGSIILAGTTFATDDRDIWVYIMDAGGNKVAEYFFGSEGEEYSSSVHVDDSGCIAIATYESKRINSQQKSPYKVIWIPQPGMDCSVGWGK